MFLKPVPLSENDGTLDQQLEACRGMPRHAAACRSMPQHPAASQNFFGDRWCLGIWKGHLAACRGWMTAEFRGP